MINCCYQTKFTQLPHSRCFSCGETKCVNCVLYCSFCDKYICKKQSQLVGPNSYDAKRICTFCFDGSSNCNTCNQILDHTIDDLSKKICVSCIQNNAAKIIQKNCYNWLWKPICKDGKLGINVIIGMQKIGIKQMKVEDLKIPDKFAITIDNVFSKDECDKLIELAEGNDFTFASVSVGGSQREVKEIRNNTRWMNDDSRLAAHFFDKIKEFLPIEWEGRKVSCLNERLRFLKYEQGEYFKPHYDGEYERDDFSEKSFITVQIYLNGDDGLKGGETTFFGSGKDQISAVYEFPTRKVKPSPGKVLIFEHEILHEGSCIDKGVKYVIRTDVMYKRKEGPETNESIAKSIYNKAVNMESEGKFSEAIKLYKEAFKLNPELDS